MSYKLTYKLILSASKMCKNKKKLHFIPSDYSVTREVN